jgi:hypothetical protein
MATHMNHPPVLSYHNKPPEIEYNMIALKHSSSCLLRSISASSNSSSSNTTNFMNDHWKGSSFFDPAFIWTTLQQQDDDDDDEEEEDIHIFEDNNDDYQKEEDDDMMMMMSVLCAELDSLSLQENEPQQFDEIFLEQQRAEETEEEKETADKDDDLWSILPLPGRESSSPFGVVAAPTTTASEQQYDNNDLYAQCRKHQQPTIALHDDDIIGRSLEIPHSFISLYNHDDDDESSCSSISVESFATALSSSSSLIKGTFDDIVPQQPCPQQSPRMLPDMSSSSSDTNLNAVEDEIQAALAKIAAAAATRRQQEQDRSKRARRIVSTRKPRRQQHQHVATIMPSRPISYSRMLSFLFVSMVVCLPCDFS